MSKEESEIKDVEEIDVINNCIERLGEIIFDDDLGEEELREYSEGLIPNVYDNLVKLVWNYNHPEIV